MFKKTYQFALGFCALLFLALAPAYADSPPDWMNGTFEGYNRTTNQTLTLRMNRSGHPIVTNQDRGRSGGRNRAEYRRGNLIIDGQEYRVERTNNGFRATEVNDRQNRVDFRRTGDYNENGLNGRDNGRGGYGQGLPDWMEGTFEGVNGRTSEKFIIEMDQGRMTVTREGRGRGTGRSTGEYRQGNLILDGREYRIQKSERGFRATDVNDRQNLIDFVRTSDGNLDWRNSHDNGEWRDAEPPPDWMNGTFEGYNRRKNQTLTLRMSRSGRALVTNQDPGRSGVWNRAVYRRGGIVIDEQEYHVERTTNGFSATQVDDRQNRVEFRRTGDYNENGLNGRDTVVDSSGDNPPDWMNGVFEGFNRKYNQTLVFQMNRDGRMSMTNQDGGRVVLRNKAEYRRGRLVIAGKEYRVEKTANGFRTIQVDDSQNRVDFRRTGNTDH